MGDGWAGAEEEAEAGVARSRGGGGGGEEGLREKVAALREELEEAEAELARREEAEAARVEQLEAALEAATTRGDELSNALEAERGKVEAFARLCGELQESNLSLQRKWEAERARAAQRSWRLAARPTRVDPSSRADAPPPTPPPATKQRKPPSPAAPSPPTAAAAGAAAGPAPSPSPSPPPPGGAPNAAVAGVVLVRLLAGAAAEGPEGRTRAARAAHWRCRTAP